MPPRSDVAPATHRALECRFLGPIRLRLDGRELNVSFKKVLGLVAYLTLEGPTSRSKLVGLLWSDLDEESARRNLRRELHRLKTKTPELHGRFEVDGEHLRLGEPWSSDARDFERAIEEDQLDSALGLYQGPLLEAFEVDGAGGFNDWLVTRREHFEKAYRRAMLALAERCETRGDWRRALELHSSLLERDDLQERTHREIMRLHYLLGEREAALAQFEKCRAMLERELGLEPLPETLHLAERIRAAGTIERTVNRGAPSASLLPARAPLVGRRDPWARMETAWAAGQLIFVSGEPGVGKTRLLLEFAASKGDYVQNAGRPGDMIAPYATATRTIGELLERGSKTELPAWVRRELSRLVPRLADEPPPPAGSPEERQRFFNAFAELVVIVLDDVSTLVSDDLQFFDAVSLEMGLYALQRFAGSSSGKRVMAAFRRGELRSEIETMVEQFVSSGQATLIELEPLNEGDVLELVRGLSGSGGATLFSKRLYRATGGNPFFALETIRSLFEVELLRFDANGGWTTPFDAQTTDYAELPIPPSVREAVLRRVKQLGSAPQRLLEAACLTADGFGLETLQGATALSEWEGLEALESAIRARVLEPFGEGYRFAHDLMRSSLEENLSLERKRLLHRKLAASLERTSDEPARIADHLEKAGQKPEAVAWRVRAAEAAQQVYANRQALEQYRKALEDGASDSEAFTILSARAELCALMGDIPAWGAEVERLNEVAARLNDPRRSNDLDIIRLRLLRQIAPEDQALTQLEALLVRPELMASQRAEVHYLTGAALFNLGRSTESEAHLNRALGLLKPETSKIGGQIHSMLGQCARDRGDFATAMRQHEWAREVFAAIGDRAGQVAQIINHSFALALSGDVGAAILGFELARDESREIGAVRQEAAALLNLGHYLTQVSRLSEAAICLEQGLALAVSSLNRSAEGVLLLNLAELRRLSGQLGPALELLHSAVRVAAELRHNRNHAIYTRDLADMQMQLGDLDGARASLALVRQVVERGGLTRLVDDLDAAFARLELSADQPARALDWTRRLESEKRESRGDPAVAWIRGAALMALGDSQAALESVSAHDDTADAEHRSRILALRLEATARLEGDLRAHLKEAETLLESGRVPPLESLELRRALVHALEVDGQALRALEVRRVAEESVLEMAATLEKHPRQRGTFIEKNRDLLSLS